MCDIDIDVLVVGAGPGGLYAAGCLARDGYRVLVCEEHSTVGEPVHCTGIVSPEGFTEFDLPREAALNALCSVRFVSPSGQAIDYSTRRPEAMVIDRCRFDRALAARATAAGAELRTGTRVRALEVFDEAAWAMAGEQVVRARLIVLACGANYGVQKQAGLGLPGEYLHTAQRELPAARLLPHVEIHFGHDIAPAGFGWAVPVVRPDGSYVRIGVMASHDVATHFGRMLRRVADNWGVATSDTPPRQKILPLGTIERTYSTRLLTVGDAAGLVKPTTGGGIYYSILSGWLAAEVGGRALSRNTLDAGSLQEYERRWRGLLDHEFKAQHALRTAAVAMSDADIDALFELARNNGVMPLVRQTARFNEHRHLIKALFSHRPARRILFRALAG